MEELNLKIEQYEGPLDLLLALIAKNKLNIFDIPIAEIAEQYMAHIEAMRRLNMEVTSEFIYYAAELMLIKSRMLLPREEEEDPRRNLVDARSNTSAPAPRPSCCASGASCTTTASPKRPMKSKPPTSGRTPFRCWPRRSSASGARLADKPEQGEWSCLRRSGRSATIPWRRSPLR